MDIRGAIIFLVSKHTIMSLNPDTIAYTLYENEVRGVSKPEWYEVTFKAYVKDGAYKLESKTCWVSVAAVNDLVIPKVTFDNPYA